MRDIEGEISHIGGRGDGVLLKDGERYFVSYTTPGDRVRVRTRRKIPEGWICDLMEVLEPGPQRVEPVCQHFFACGGCGLQMLDDAAYAQWKTARVRAALRRRDLDDSIVMPLVLTPPHARRRVEFAVRRLSSAVMVGFHEAQGKRILDIEECAIAYPSLVGLLAPLRAVLFPYLGVGQTLDAKASLTDQGVDLVLKGEFSLTLAARQALVDFARKQRLVRLALKTKDALDVLLIQSVPQLHFGSVAVDLPSDGFLQAAPQAEAAMQAIASTALKGLGPVADLFSGCGSFSFPLVDAGHKVAAFDSNAEAIAALNAAASRAALGGKIVGAVRDLVMRPLMAKELDAYQAVVFDPPYAGAREQSLQLAATKKLRTLVGISCNPDSFARDAAILVQGGWRLESVTPIDQFLWSNHIELVAVLRRT